MKLIISYIRRHLGIFLISTAFLAMEASSDLLQPTVMSLIVDNGIAESDIGKVLSYGALMLLIAAVGAFSAVMRNHFASRTSQTVGKEIRSDIYRNVQSLSLENIDRLRPASIITRITNDVTQIQDFVNTIMRISVKAPITCIGAIILIIIQTPKQAPVMVGIILVVSLLIVLNMKTGYPKFEQSQKKLDALNGTSREFLSAVRVVKAFRAEDDESEKFGRASEELAAANTEALRVMALYSPLINLTVNMGIVILLAISKDQKSSEIGKLMASVNYMTQVLSSVGFISNAINTAVRAVASSGRIREVLDEKPAQHMSEHPLFPEIEGNVEFKNVFFTYAGASRPSLRDVSFRLESGKTLGIIGPTGSGKTTLIDLVPRLYDATQGCVLVDGLNVNDIDLNTLRTAAAVVSQKPVLFSGTIGENLRWGRESASDEEIREAARIACADDFIQKTADGYDTVLGQGGVNLSGGQKQRLSLARALVRNPRILILDDCTSALDARTEAAVLSALRNMTRKMTVFLISQRITTVMKADAILCLDNGRVAGLGTHAELMSSCPEYRAIYESQMGGTENAAE